MLSYVRAGLGLLAIAAAAMTVPAAGAFTISKPEGKATSRTLEFTERWDIDAVLDGLDYSIHDSICKDVRFVDGSTCEEIKAAVRSTFDLWAKGHAYLHFNDVTATHPIFTRRGQSGVREIGVSSMSAAERNGLDWTRSDLGEVIGLAHTSSLSRRRGGSAIKEAGVMVNDKFCFYLDFARIDWDAQKSCRAVDGEGAGSAHEFRAVLAHEIGHALGLDHPDLEGSVNFDDDDVRDNPIKIDCMSPSANLRVSPNISVFSVMNRSPDYPIGRGLSYDDLAGRDFLYPACETQPHEFDATPQAPYAAVVAYAPDGDMESGALRSASWDAVSSVRSALDRCHEKYGVANCRYVGGSRLFIYATVRMEMKDGIPKDGDIRILIGTGDTEAAATDAVKDACDIQAGLSVCLPVGVFDPVNDPPFWLRPPEEETPQGG